MGMQRPLGQAKKGCGHFVLLAPDRVTEKWQVKEENIKELSQHEDRNWKFYLYCNVFQGDFSSQTTI